MQYQLRPYQQTAVDNIFLYMAQKDGNPVVIAPTGAGKSIIIAEVCHRGITWWPETKILILSHQKELLEQDKAKLEALLPEADIGVYSASLGSKDVSHSITYASIQSIARLEDCPHFDIILVDECHLINNDEQGQYRKFIASQGCRVIGFTATPYRLGQGTLVEDGSLFDDYIETIGIRNLQDMGYLSLLKTKGTLTTLDSTGVKVQAGEFIQRDLDKAINIYETNEAIATEIANCATRFNRSHILVFCTSVEHAYNMAHLLNEKGIVADTVEGAMSKTVRDETIKGFTNGYIQALTNVNILTTGFDYPAVDLIAMVRPTMSPGLYSQILGRGLRVAEGKKNCLVLDFAENVQRHGALTDIRPPQRNKSKGDGVAPSKTCPACLEIVPASSARCPSCGHEFPKHSRIYSLYMGDINGGEETVYIIEKWSWIQRLSKAGLPMYHVTYKVAGEEKEIPEFMLHGYEGTAGAMTYGKLKSILLANDITESQWTRNGTLDGTEMLEYMCILCSELPPPEAISTKPDGKYTRICARLFAKQAEEEIALDMSEREIMNKTLGEVYGKEE